MSKTKHTTGKFEVGYESGLSGSRTAAFINLDLDENIREIPIRCGNHTVCVIAEWSEDNSHDIELMRADAEFIVRACNSHYDLLEALEYINRQIHSENIHDYFDMGILNNAIKKATE